MIIGLRSRLRLRASTSAVGADANEWSSIAMLWMPPTSTASMPMSAPTPPTFMSAPPSSMSITATFCDPLSPPTSCT
eukprot:4208478-Alexandrium_andersonii.AAC.1